MPAPLGPISGKWGVAVANGVAISTARNWMVNNVAMTKPFVASNTRGGHGRRRGYMDWSGKYEQYCGSPTLMPGEFFTFQGYIGPRNGAPGGIGPCVSGLAIVDSIRQVINWKTGDIILTTVNFSGNGELAAIADAVFQDTSAIEALSSSIAASPGIWYGPGESMQSLPLCCNQATLTVSSDNKTIMNSCGNGFMKRARGTIDWRLDLVLDEPDVSSLIGGVFKPNKYCGVQLFVDQAAHWILEWGLVKEFTNFNVDRESGEIIDYTVPIEMSIDNGEGTANDGRIVFPNGTTWFPENTSA